MSHEEDNREVRETNEKRGGKELPQLQVIGMYEREATDNNPFLLEFTNYGKKTIHVTEGRGVKGSRVMKNSIVNYMSVSEREMTWNEMGEEELFEKITKLLDRKVPVVTFGYRFNYGDQEFANFELFRENYSSTYSFD